MAGIALVLDLLNKNPTNLLRPTLHSYGFFSAEAAASSAASSAVLTAPFAAWAFLGNGGPRIAYCDAGGVLTEDYSSSIDRSTLQKDALYYSTKEYIIVPKPLLSAFHWKNLAMTSLRSFLLFFLPLLEHVIKIEDDDDFLEDLPTEEHVDLVKPFKKSVKQILRETTVVTTRRILERFAIHYLSRRMAWKLLKDAPQSAARKATRGMPSFDYIYCVSMTTFRAHCLGVLASWIVQVGVDFYRFLSFILNYQEEINEDDREEIVRFYSRKIRDNTARCCASLVLASIGAGIGAAIIRPSTGQWIGCAVGDLAGPVVVALWSGKTFK